MPIAKAFRALCTSPSFRNTFARPIGKLVRRRGRKEDRRPDPARVRLHRERIAEIGDQLIEKIRSKFTAVTLMAGFALSVLVLEIATLWQDPMVPATLPFSIGATAFALGMFMVALVKLDALTMPKRFWEEAEEETAEIAPTGPRDGDTVILVLTNPSARAAFYTEEDLWAIYHRMVFYWSYGALTAAVVTAIGAMALLYPAPLDTATWARQPAWRAIWLAAGGTLAMYWLMAFGACVLSDSLLRTHD